MKDNKLTAHYTSTFTSQTVLLLFSSWVFFSESPFVYHVITVFLWWSSILSASVIKCSNCENCKNSWSFVVASSFLHSSKAFVGLGSCNNNKCLPDLSICTMHRGSGFDNENKNYRKPYTATPQELCSSCLRILQVTAKIKMKLGPGPSWSLQIFSKSTKITCFWKRQCCDRKTVQIEAQAEQ